MPFDLTRCPQTEDEARDWFYAGIGQTRGAPATNWEAVMTNCGLPPGYGPGVVPNASMPYFAFTQQFSGGPKGRIFLPSATPDENGYYTRCMQYLDDAAQTYSHAKDPAAASFTKAKSGALVWAWYWVAGHAYTPVQPADATTPVPPPASGLTEAEVQAMIDDSIAQALVGVVKLGDHIGLRCSGDGGREGKVFCAEGGGPTENHQPVTLTGRASVGPWESFRIEEGQG